MSVCQLADVCLFFFYFKVSLQDPLRPVPGRPGRLCGRFPLGPVPNGPAADGGVPPGLPADGLFADGRAAPGLSANGRDVPGHTDDGRVPDILRRLSSGL